MKAKRSVKAYCNEDKELWREVTRLFPDAVRLEHPDDETWIVIADKKNKAPHVLP